MKPFAILAALSVILGAGAARAEDGPKAICADRPAKGASPCTADPGHWQVEVDAADWTHDRSAGVTTASGVFASTNIKYGISDRLDLELNISPYQFQQADGAGRAQGFGDLTARAKIAVIGGANAVSLLPYLKIPTAGAGLGNGAVEGGLVVPIGLTLPAGTTLTLNPEIDALADGAGPGHHPAYALAAGLSRPLTSTFTGTVEVWGEQDDDPAGRLREASFDLGLAWIPAKDQDLQLDGGANLGLNRQTPNLNLYVGVSRRF